MSERRLRKGTKFYRELRADPRIWDADPTWPAAALAALYEISIDQVYKLRSKLNEELARDSASAS